MTTRASPALGMLLATSLIASADAVGKYLAGQYGVAPLFVAWSHFALGTVFLLPFLPRHCRGIAIFRDGRVWLRGILLVATLAGILTALESEPMADVYGAFFIAPILAYALAAVFLKEVVSTGRTIYLLIGFAGVLLVVRPGMGMSTGILIGLLAGTTYGTFLAMNRRLAVQAPPMALLFSQLVIGGLLLSPFAFVAAPPITIPVISFLSLNALFSLLGNLFLIFLFRRHEASRLAPFVYFELIAATILGWFVFHDLPDGFALAGLALIIGSGLAAIAMGRERKGAMAGH